MTKSPEFLPRQVRQLIREGRWTGPTAGAAPGYAQANLVVIPKENAFDFLLFAQRNPKACPVIDVVEPRRGPVAGPMDRSTAAPALSPSAEPFTAPSVSPAVSPFVAPGADLRTDLPRYRIYRDGELAGEVTDATPLWRDDMVAFLLGCSFTFENALLKAGVPVRHIEEGRNVPMYVTDRQCRPAGAFAGPMVVSMRPVPADLVAKAIEVTAPYTGAHGAPVHVGNPAELGIADLARPDFGDAVTVRAGEVPVFWACGVTSQAALMQARLPLAITHAPGHMFITDLRDEDLRRD